MEKALSLIKNGMTAQEVDAIIGKHGLELMEYGGEKVPYSIYNYDGMRYHYPMLIVEYTQGYTVSEAYVVPKNLER